MSNPVFSHETFISPLTWRYGSLEMRKNWSEDNKRKLLRKIWVALASAQHDAGLVSDIQLKELKEQQNNIDIGRASEIEEKIHHDLMAEIKTYAEQCPHGGAIIHMGATSMDVLDNMDALRLNSALDILKVKLKKLLGIFADKIEQTKDIPYMAFTHIQSAEPTTVGYRLAQTAQDLVFDYQDLVSLTVFGKGMKGAVGTAASYKALLKGTGMSADEMEKKVMDSVGLKAFDCTTQVYPRKQDLRIMQRLSSLACTISKFAMDFRILQSSSIGEWSENFGKFQVGSSAMPFKRNPINCEKVNSLTRYIRSLETSAWDNASLSILERTLDDSANRRLFFPQAFISMDEVLITITKVVDGMNFHQTGIDRNLSTFGVFAATEKLLMELGRHGADRQEMHELIRKYSLNAWKEVQEGKVNNLRKDLSHDKTVMSYISSEEAYDLLSATDYVGTAPERAELIVEKIRKLN